MGDAERLAALCERVAAALSGQDQPLHALTYRCIECQDTGWIISTVAARPCRRCNPVVHRRWREGHYRFKHSCAECDLARSGGLKVGRDVDRETGEVFPGVL